MGMIASLTIGVQAVTTGLTKGLNSAGAELKKFALNATGLKGFTMSAGGAMLVAAAATAAAAAVTVWFKATAEAAAENARFASRIGLTTEALEAFQYAANRSGVSSESFDRDVEILLKNIGELQSDSESAKTSFSKIGLTAKDFDGKDTAAQIQMVIGAIGNLDSQASKIDVARAIMGKSGSSIVELADQGAGGLKRLTDEFKDLGLAVDKTPLLAAQASMVKLGAVLGALGDKLMVAIAPAFEMISDLLTNIISSSAGIATVDATFGALSWTIVKIGQTVSVVWNVLMAGVNALSVVLLEVISALETAYVTVDNAVGGTASKSKALSTQVENAHKRTEASAKAAWAAQQKLFGTYVATGDAVQGAGKKAETAQDRMNAQINKSTQSAIDMTRDLDEKLKAIGKTTNEAAIEELERKHATKDSIYWLKQKDRELQLATKIYEITSKNPYREQVKSVKDITEYLQKHKDLKDGERRAIVANAREERKGTLSGLGIQETAQEEAYHAIEKLQNAVKDGVKLTPENLQRGIAAAREKLGESRHSGAQDLGSRESYSTILQATSRTGQLGIPMKQLMKADSQLKVLEIIARRIKPQGFKEVLNF